MPRPSPPSSPAPGDSPEGASERERPYALSAEDGLDHTRIRRALAGEEGAFEELVSGHQQRAFRLARNLVPNDEDARDLVQEAFLRAFRSLERFDFQYAFGTWLARIVTNLGIDHLRRRRPGAQEGGGEEAGEAATLAERLEADVPAPWRRLEADETAQRVRDCIATLAPHFQAVLVLRELQGLPCTEIARIVGATHVTVRWRLHRGRKLFQEAWERMERLGPERPSRPAAPARAGGIPPTSPPAARNPPGEP